MSLRPCQACGRHVRNNETACPFCATALEAVPDRAPVVLPRAGRAAIVAFGALASAGAGCNVMALYGAPPVDAGPGADAFVAQLDAREAPDAAAPTDDAAMTTDDAAMAESDTGGGMNLYGGPPTDAGGNDDDAGGVAALYGGAGL